MLPEAARSNFGRLRAVSGSLGRLRAASGFARNCSEEPRKRPGRPESVRNGSVLFRAASKL
eukprot:786504-Alexandrium_andersonii.AAC.1